MEWYLRAWKQYAVFSGRARRKEYWTFALGQFIAFAVVIQLDRVIFGTPGAVDPSDPMAILSLYGPLYWAFALVAFVPGLAVLVRRLHDRGKSGWFGLVGLIPVLGWIWILVLLLGDSQPGDNQYGPNPKAL